LTFFMTNNSGQLLRRQTQNVFNEWTYAQPITVPCAVVALVDMVAKTAVRTDLSATRGTAEEETVMAKILFSPSINIREDDQFLIAGIKMRVDKIQPRYDILGRHDHDEATLEHLT